MDKKDGGKKSEIRGEHACSFDDLTPDRNRQPRSASSSNEVERPIGVDCTDRTGENFSDGYRERPTGKILGQLRQLREAHLAYVKAHEERLEARLKENKQHQSKIIEEMNRLERDIVHLLEEKQSE